MYFETKMAEAINCCNGRIITNEAGQFFRIYPFSNENISGYLPLFDLKGKSLLTVGSSCDQIISANFMGCTDITSIDICPFIEDYFNLKKAAIEKFIREEFLEYFCYKDYPETFTDNKNCFSLEYFYRLKDYLRLLNYESYLLWDELFQTFKGLDVREYMFSLDEPKFFVLEKTLPYLSNDENYERERINLRKLNPKFIHGNIFDIKIDRKFDVIFLSNVGRTHKVKKILDLFEGKILDLLKDDGKVLICYLYDTTKSTEYNENWEEIYNLDKVFKTFPNGIELENFIGMQGILHERDTIQDAILTYKK